MYSINSKLIFIQIVVFILALVVFIVISILTSPLNFEQSFLFSYVALRSLILLIKFYIPITLLGFVVCFAMVISHKDILKLKHRSYYFLIRGAIIFTIVMGFLYSFILFFIEPWSIRQLDFVELRSDFINSSIDRAYNYFERQNYILAEVEVQNVLAIIPLHEEANNLFQDIIARIPETPVTQIIEEVQDPLPLGLSFDEIVRRAEQNFLEGDYFTAIFYARLALGQDGERNNPEAEQILAESIEYIESIDLSSEEDAEKNLFTLKRSGAEAFNNNEIITAYYIFKEVQSIRPLDKDAETYLEEIQVRIENIRFFEDELTIARAGDTRKNVFVQLPLQNFVLENTFTNANSRNADLSPDDSPIVSFLVAEEVLFANSGVYLINAEYLEVTAENVIQSHIRIPAAKVMETHLVMRVLDRESNRELYSPEVLIGRNTDQVLEIGLNSSQLWEGSFLASNLDTLFITNLFNYMGAPLPGIDPAFIQSELLYRIGFPISLLYLSLLSIALAWKGRSRYISRISSITLIVFPIIPILLFLAFLLFENFFRTVLVSIVLSFSIEASLALLIGGQLLTFIIVLIVVSRQKLPFA